MAILLAGLPGAGKSTWLKKFQENWKDWECLDLDVELLGASPYRSIQKWVDSEGWDSFREKEEAFLRDKMTAPRTILALGGGSLNLSNFEEVNRASFLVLVEVEPHLAWARIKDDYRRPLTERGRVEVLKIFEQRLEFLNKITVRISQDESFAQVSERLLEQI